jgi:hypothetical protein
VQCCISKPRVLLGLLHIITDVSIIEPLTHMPGAVLHIQKTTTPLSCNMSAARDYKETVVETHTGLVPMIYLNAIIVAPPWPSPTKASQPPLLAPHHTKGAACCYTQRRTVSNPNAHYK